MKILRDILDKQEKHFVEGGKLKLFYPLYEMFDTLLFNTNRATKGSVHVRDGIDLKKMMTMVIVALTPVILMSLYNTGYQINSALAGGTFSNWRESIITFLKLGHNPNNIIDNFTLGALYFVPLYIVVQMAGGLWEVLFSVVRKHEVNEGFFVTGMLFPLLLPHDIPLWQAAIGISFGIIIAKEVFGGTGFNFLNPALAARAFLFFSYPQDISGDSVWVHLDGLTTATPLASIGTGLYSWTDSFIGLVPGSFGETSTLAIMLGALILIITKVGSWRIMLSTLLSMIIVTLIFNFFAKYSSNPMYAVKWSQHLVMGGFAFGAVFMATDPVTACVTNKGKIIYGSLIGLLVILVRNVNPAFPEGMMMAILFANSFSPIIDYFVVKKNIKRREIRSGL